MAPTVESKPVLGVPKGEYTFTVVFGATNTLLTQIAAQGGGYPRDYISGYPYEYGIFEKVRNLDNFMSMDVNLSQVRGS